MIVTYRVLLDDQIFTKWPMMCKLVVLKFEQFKTDCPLHIVFHAGCQVQVKHQNLGNR